MRWYPVPPRCCRSPGRRRYRRGVGGHRVGATAQRGGTVADGVGRVGGQGVVTVHQGTGLAIGVAAGLELTAGPVGDAGNGIQLALVHRVGGFGTGCHMGHLAFATGLADGHGVVTVGLGAGTEGDTVAAVGGGVGAQGRGIAAGPRVPADCRGVVFGRPCA